MPHKTYYFDYAAATPVDPSVLKAMIPYFSDKFYNPSAQYESARQIAKELRLARSRVAEVLGVRSSEIIFTAGGTEANNLALSGIMSRFPGSKVAFSAVEHDSIRLSGSRYEHIELSVTRDGRVDLEKLSQKISSDTVLVSVMYVNNEIGTVQPLKHVAEIITTIRKQRLVEGNKLPIYFHTDASQAGNYLSLNPKALGVDMMTVNGGKLYGPKQTGLLFRRAGIELEPIIAGGGQEFGLRNGTENVAGIIGLTEAIVQAQEIRKQESLRMEKLQKLFVDEVTELVPNLFVNGSKYKIPNNVHITIPGSDNERVMMTLDERGVQAAVGSACGASNDEPSHVLKAIGMSDVNARSSLRFSMGRSTTEESVRYATSVLADACKPLTQ